MREDHDRRARQALRAFGPRAEGGFSLVEWAISVVLLAMLAAGGFMLFQVIANTSERSDAQTAMDEYADAVASEIRRIGWGDCYLTAPGGLFTFFEANVASRMNPAGPNPIVKPASTQGESSNAWQVQDPVVENVQLGAGLKSASWEEVPAPGDPPNPDLATADCSNFFVARVTFVVRNYDPSAPEKPSIPVEIRRQVLVTRS